MTSPTKSTQTPYLRIQRNFPNDNLKELSNQVDHAYIDIALKVNSRTVGIFPVNTPTVTGEKWYLKGDNYRQQTLRRVYEFTSAGSILHGIPSAEITSIPRGFGTYSDGTNYYGAIYASITPIAGQVSFYVTATHLVILSGGGAPSITSGLIVLEWMSQTTTT